MSNSSTSKTDLGEQAPEQISDTVESCEAAPEFSREALDAELKSILSDVLGLDAEDAAQLDDDSGLFGHLPELDSMAVAGLLTEMEDRLDMIIEDDDVDGEMLETFGGLLDFAFAKANEG